MAALIEATGLTKLFGDRTAVDGVDVTVHAGEAFGVLRPNGAGTSSTMRMIAAGSPLTAGFLRIFGLDPATDGPDIRAGLGVLPQRDSLDEELTVEENLCGALGVGVRCVGVLGAARRFDRLLRAECSGVGVFSGLSARPHSRHAERRSYADSNKCPVGLSTWVIARVSSSTA